MRRICLKNPEEDGEFLQDEKKNMFLPIRKDTAGAADPKKDHEEQHIKLRR